MFVQNMHVVMSKWLQFKYVYARLKQGIFAKENGLAWLPDRSR